MYEFEIKNTGCDKLVFITSYNCITNYKVNKSTSKLMKVLRNVLLKNCCCPFFTFLNLFLGGDGRGHISFLKNGAGTSHLYVTFQNCCSKNQLFHSNLYCQLTEEDTRALILKLFVNKTIYK